jgi:hypothetical protein
MSVIPLSTESVGIQQKVPAGGDFVGDNPPQSAIDDAVFSQSRNVVAVPDFAGDGGGLFFPSDYLATSGKQTYATHVMLFSSAAFNWTISVTSGLGDGTATKVDDPVHDAAIATGSANVHQRMNVELLQSQGIRVVTTGGSAPIYALVLMANVSGDSGRLIS